MTASGSVCDGANDRNGYCSMGHVVSIGKVSASNEVDVLSVRASVDETSHAVGASGLRVASYWINISVIRHCGYEVRVGVS